MKSVLWEHFGRKQGVKKKQPSQTRIQKLLKKKRLKKKERNDNATE